MRRLISHQLLVVVLVSSSPATTQAETVVATPRKCKRTPEPLACRRCLERSEIYHLDPYSRRWVCGSSTSNPPAPGWRRPPPKKPPLGKSYSTYVTIRPSARPGAETARPFLIKASAVTHGEWFNVMGELHRLYSEPCGMGCPVLATASEATAYLDQLSARTKLEECYGTSADAPMSTAALDCKGYRLPTEAERALVRPPVTDDQNGFRPARTR